MSRHNLLGLRGKLDLAFMVAVVLAANVAQGQYTYVPAASTPGSWTDPARWSIGGSPAPDFPNGANVEAILNLPLSTTLDPAGATNFNLNFGNGVTITLGSLTINSANTAHEHRINTGANLIFQSTSGPATYTETAGTSTSLNARFRINANVAITLASDLNLTQNNSPHLNTGTQLAGRLDGGPTVTLTKNGVGGIQFDNDLDLGATQGYEGKFVINEGAIRLIGKSALTKSTGVTVNDGGQLQLAESNASPVPNYALANGAVLTLNGLGKDENVAGIATPEGALRFGLGTNGTSISFNSKVVLQSDSRIHSPTAGKSGILTQEVSGAGALIKSGPGQLTLTADNIFSGGTRVNNGLLQISGPSASLGSGDVTVFGATLGTFLKVDSDVVDAFAPSATLTLAGGNITDVADSGYLDLGINETVSGLVLGANVMAPGEYGSTASGAMIPMDEYFTGSGRLLVSPSFLAADFDNSGAVNDADFATWRAGFGDASGQSKVNGDANGDQDVDGADFLVWQQQFGAPGQAVSAAGTIPEPTAALLLALASPAVMLRRRRR